VPITNVSDTARWVAWYRVMETERADAIFRDPFARRLAGAEGEALMHEMPGGLRMAPALIVRTAVIDELILDRVRHHGVDLIVNLGAGLDARPWRLPLPPDLRWFDVDHPGVLEYKTAELRDDRTTCRYEAVPVDLGDARQRGALLERLGHVTGTGMIITEGLLVYLPPELVAALATELHAAAPLDWWIADLASPRLLRIIERSHAGALDRAPMRFAPAESGSFFAQYGWREREFHGAMDDARRLGRRMRGTWIWYLLYRLQPAARREEFRRMSGVTLLERVP